MSDNFRLVGMRLPKNGGFYQGQFSKFFETIITTFYKSVNYMEFGKQDQRGGFSICFYEDDVSIKQVHFESKDHLLGFVVGFNCHSSGAIL